jgi:endoglucanase
MGNILARYGRQNSNPLVFVAHTDHPGFIIEKNSVRNRTTALFHGGVEKEYFRKNTAVCVFTANGSVKGKILKVHFDKKKRLKRVRLSVEKAVCKGDLAMWDLPVFRIQGDKLMSRACDDLAGCASILAMLDEVYRRRIRRSVTALFTAAEEPGLHGAKFAAMKRLIPKGSTAISVETSSASPKAPVGKGVVIRVGDRSSIFHPAITKWMLDAAKTIQNKYKTFCYQRKLMDAGTCEASVFTAFGYMAGALCIPLGNYHNRDFKRKKIASEFISCRDLQNMVKLFLVLVQTGVSGLKLIQKQPTYKKRYGTLGEVFWE